MIGLSNKHTRIIVIVIGSLIVVSLIALAFVYGMKALNDANDEATTTQDIAELRHNADDERAAGIAALEENDQEAALTHFKEAREQYLEADEAEGTYGPENPSPEVVDMNAQIDFLESFVPPAEEPQQAPEDLPVTDDNSGDATNE